VGAEGTRAAIGSLPLTAVTGTKVLVLVKDLHVRITSTDGQPIRELDLDPTRNYQPQPRT